MIIFVTQHRGSKMFWVSLPKVCRTEEISLPRYFLQVCRTDQLSLPRKKKITTCLNEMLIILSWFLLDFYKTASYNRTATLLQLMMTSFCYCCGPSCAQEGGLLLDQSKRQWTHRQKLHHSQRDQKYVVPLPSSTTTSSTSFFFSSAATTTLLSLLLQITSFFINWIFRSQLGVGELFTAGPETTRPLRYFEGSFVWAHNRKKLVYDYCARMAKILSSSSSPFFYRRRRRRPRRRRRRRRRLQAQEQEG